MRNVILFIAITQLKVGKISGQINREFYNFLYLIWFKIGLNLDRLDNRYSCKRSDAHLVYSSLFILLKSFIFPNRWCLYSINFLFFVSDYCTTKAQGFWSQCGSQDCQVVNDRKSFGHKIFNFLFWIEEYKTFLSTWL